MAQYSIKELEELSGIKAHTIRIWEKRYAILSPERTTTNIRLYSDADLKKVISVSLLNQNGLKISKIADLSSEELSIRISQLSENQTTPEFHMDRLVMTMVDLDEERFESTLNELIKRFGFEYSILRIVYPFLEKIGVLWLSGNITPLQEHFISNLLRQKILVAIDRLPLAPRTSPGILLFLPQDEMHELGLLFNYYLVKKEGFRGYYMGQRVPYEDVKWFCQHHSPLAMVTNITTSPGPHFVEPYLQTLCLEHPGISVFAGGPQPQKMALSMPKNLHIVENSNQLQGLLRGLQLKGTNP